MPDIHREQRRRLCLGLPLAAALPLGAVAADAVLEVGVLPNLNARVLMAQYQPVREYLQREAARPVQVSTAPNWASFHQRTMNLDYELVFTGAHMARVAQLDKGFRPLLMLAPDIKGLLVTATAQPMRSVAELRGRKLVLSNPQSLVTLRGLAWLSGQGLQRGREYQAIDTPTDDSVGAVVLRGEAVAAMCSGGEFRAIPEGLRSQLQVMATFAEVPGFVVLASPKLAPEQAALLRRHLLRFAQGSEEGKAYFGATGFQALREVPPGLMEELDVYAEPTRRLLQPRG